MKKCQYKIKVIDKKSKKEVDFQTTGLMYDAHIKASMLEDNLRQKYPSENYVLRKVEL